MHRGLITLGVIFVITTAACGGPKGYPMNLHRDLVVAPQIREAVERVEGDRPAKWREGGSDFERYVFQMNMMGQSPNDALPQNLRSRYDKATAKQWRAMKRGSHSISYRSRLKGQAVTHQVTAGLLDIPFQTLRTRWYVPSEWGRSLSDYKGGTLAIDQKDHSGRTVLQRERMVLGTPWYAIGAPDLDMSKYEIVDYAHNRLQISWIVSASSNRSVLVDVGYLRLCGIRASGRDQTLVIFNSVHRIDPGWLGGFTPDLVEDNLRQAFKNHVAKYRRIAAKLEAAPRH